MENLKIMWVSVSNLTIINKYIKEGWKLKKIYYLDSSVKGNRVKSGYYSKNIEINFTRG